MEIAKAEARRLAAEIIKLFEGTCERIEPFGDLFAPRPDVRSIEIRCLPIRRPDWDANENPIGPVVNWQYRRLQELVKAGTLTKRSRFGVEQCSEQFQGLKYGDIPVEIFCYGKAEHWPGAELIA